MSIIVIRSMRLIAQQRQDVYGLGPNVHISLAAQHLTKQVIMSVQPYQKDVKQMVHIVWRLIIAPPI